MAEKLSIANWGIDRDVFAFATRYVPFSAMRPNLAESWETPDPNTIVINIRPGVRWHNKAPMNGRELTAQDVEYNFHRLTGLGSGFTEVTQFALHECRDMGIDYGHRRFHGCVQAVKAPRSGGLEVIVTHWFHFIMPPEVIEQHGNVHDWRNLVGTGP